MISGNLENKHRLWVTVREFRIPPINEGLVLGRDAPIGCNAIAKALDLLTSNTFENIAIEDDVISHVIIRRAVLRRLPKERLVEFVLTRVKPLMGPEEVLHLDLEAEVYLEGKLV